MSTTLPRAAYSVAGTRELDGISIDELGIAALELGCREFRGDSGPRATC